MARQAVDRQAILTQEMVLPYLLRNGVVAPGSVVESEVSVESAEGRNVNYRVMTARGLSFLVKQSAEEDGYSGIRNEAGIYAHLGSLGSRGVTAPFLPRLYFYSPGDRVLVLELLQSSETLFDYHSRFGRFPLHLARQLGSALASIHFDIDTHCRRVTGTGTSQPRHTISECDPPWILSIHEPGANFCNKLSQANIQLLEVVQRFPEIGRCLGASREQWRHTALVHYDIKWDNLLVAGRKRSLKIIDWELSGMGDPAWDVGSAFAAYVGFWLESIPVSAGMMPDRAMSLAVYPLHRMQPAIRAFWQSYIGQASLCANEATAMLLRATGYAAARLIQSAFERNQDAARITARDLCTLQLGLNMLSNPLEAAVYLLTITPHTMHVEQPATVSRQ